MRAPRLLLPALLFLAMALPRGARAEELISPFAGAFFASPGAQLGVMLWGGQLMGGVLMAVPGDRNLVLGLRGSVLGAKGSGQGMGITRWDFAAGPQATFWFFNAVGPGLAVDWVFRTRENSVPQSTFLRIEPFVAARLKRLGEEGALEGRIGPTIDTRARGGSRWGVQAGIVLQFCGVPSTYTE